MQSAGQGFLSVGRDAPQGPRTVEGSRERLRSGTQLRSDDPIMLRGQDARSSEGNRGKAIRRAFAEVEYANRRRVQELVQG